MSHNYRAAGCSNLCLQPAADGFHETENLHEVRIGNTYFIGSNKWWLSLSDNALGDTVQDDSQYHEGNACTLLSQPFDKSLAGFVKISSDVPICRISPLRMMAIRSPNLMASSQSWVTNTIVFFFSDFPFTLPFHQHFECSIPFTTENKVKLDYFYFLFLIHKINLPFIRSYFSPVKHKSDLNACLPNKQARSNFIVIL